MELFSLVWWIITIWTGGVIYWVLFGAINGIPMKPGVYLAIIIWPLITIPVTIRNMWNSWRK